MGPLGLLDQMVDWVDGMMVVLITVVVVAVVVVVGLIMMDGGAAITTNIFRRMKRSMSEKEQNQESRVIEIVHFPE